MPLEALGALEGRIEGDKPTLNFQFIKVNTNSYTHNTENFKTNGTPDFIALMYASR